MKKKKILSKLVVKRATLRKLGEVIENIYGGTDTYDCTVTCISGYEYCGGGGGTIGHSRCYGCGGNTLSVDPTCYC
jgi:hypothetical protein